MTLMTVLVRCVNGTVTREEWVQKSQNFAQVIRERPQDMLMIQHRILSHMLSGLVTVTRIIPNKTQNCSKSILTCLKHSLHKCCPHFHPRLKLSTFIAHSHDFSVIHSFLPFHVALHCTSIICFLSFKGTKRNSMERSTRTNIDFSAAGQQIDWLTSRNCLPFSSFP